MITGFGSVESTVIEELVGQACLARKVGLVITLQTDDHRLLKLLLYFNDQIIFKLLEVLGLFLTRAPAEYSL